MSRKIQTLSALTLGVGAALLPVAAQADEMSDLKELVKELKSEVQEQRTQVQDLKAQVNGLNAQLTDQKAQVNAQATQVQNQDSAIQKVQAEQQVIEQKQAAPVVAADADNPGYIAVPGTKTSVKIGGYVKLDAVDDVSGKLSRTGASGLPAGYNSTNFDATAVPLANSADAHRSGQFNLSAQESRLNVGTLTHTDALGDIKTVIEADFYNPYGNGSFLRLRHAYVSAAGWTAGQTWSTFDDLETGGPETLDYGGPVGFAASRHAQLRYTAALPTGNLAAAIEAPTASVSAVQGVSDSHIDKAPDLAVKYTVDPSWGHFAVAGLGRYLSNDSGTAVGPHTNTLAYGVLLGIGVKTFGKDTFVFQTVDGNGIGSYMEQGEGVTAIVQNNDIKPINIWGGTVGYTHYWIDALRSNVAYGYSHFGTPAGEGSTVQPIKALSSVHANLIWSPVAATDVGIEYIWGRLEDSAPYAPAGTTATTGTASRIEGSVKYSF